jgi:hypothetical protein
VLLDAGGAPAQDVARLRLVCLVRSGDGYLIRAVGRLSVPDGTRSHLDISFGGPGTLGGRNGGQGRGADLEGAVRLIQRWCDEGTPVDLVECSDRLALRADDGTEVVLPRG